MFILRMHAEVDNEEGSTIHLYKKYAIQNVWDYATDFNQVSTK